MCHRALDPGAPGVERPGSRPAGSVCMPARQKNHGNVHMRPRPGSHHHVACMPMHICGRGRPKGACKYFAPAVWLRAITRAAAAVDPIAHVYIHAWVRFRGTLDMHGCIVQFQPDSLCVLPARPCCSGHISLGPPSARTIALLISARGCGCSCMEAAGGGLRGGRGRENGAASAQGAAAAASSMQAQPPLAESDAAPPPPWSAYGDGRQAPKPPMPSLLLADIVAARQPPPAAQHAAAAGTPTPTERPRPAIVTHATPAEQSRAEQSRANQLAAPAAAAAAATVPTAAAPAAAAAGVPEAAAAPAARIKIVRPTAPQQAPVAPVIGDGPPRTPWHVHDVWFRRYCSVATGPPYTRVPLPQLSAPGVAWPRLNLHPTWPQGAAGAAEAGYNLYPLYWTSGYWLISWPARSGGLQYRGNVDPMWHRRGEAVRPVAGTAPAAEWRGCNAFPCAFPIEAFMRIPPRVPQVLEVPWVRRLRQEVGERANAPGDPENATEQAAAAERSPAEGRSAGCSSGSAAGPAASSAATANDGPDVADSGSVQVPAPATAKARGKRGRKRGKNRPDSAAAGSSSSGAVNPEIYYCTSIIIELLHVVACLQTPRVIDAIAAAELSGGAPEVALPAEGDMVGWEAATYIPPSASVLDRTVSAEEVRLGKGEEHGWADDCFAGEPDMPDLDPLTQDKDLWQRLEELVTAMKTNPYPPPRQTYEKRGRVIIEACGPRSYPTPAELADRAFFHDMRRQWQNPDRAAQTLVGEGHAGPAGLFLRNVAFNQAWGGVVAAARRACVRAWRKQVEGGACTNGFEPVRLTIFCGNGRHRSVAAAYLLGAVLVACEGAAEAEVHLREFENPPCDCPDITCPLYTGPHPQRTKADATLSTSRAMIWTVLLMQADQSIMPSDEIR